ncbi:hypothetical protein E2C01_085103 [Portunus trituberculatus]|uniref:Uncharacterized protein n=1 Tax=Portunus trituberculatus TaxID=210409 RepID=A0A5B7J6J1_PORTR|nr:hypothetical protein [Portunus trituberculatus]
MCQAAQTLQGSSVSPLSPPHVDTGMAGVVPQRQVTIVSGRMGPPESRPRVGERDDANHSPDSHRLLFFMVPRN